VATAGGGDLAAGVKWLRRMHDEQITAGTLDQPEIEGFCRETTLTPR
jgi:hypothetical protein